MELTKLFNLWNNTCPGSFLITGTHLGPISELTKILSFWKKFGSILELSKFQYLKHILGPEMELTKIFNLWNNTCFGPILITGTHLGPISELTKILSFWKKFGYKLELSKFQYLKHILGPEMELTKLFNLWNNTCPGPILTTGTHLGPILELTKILSFWKKVWVWSSLSFNIWNISRAQKWSSPRYSISETILVLGLFW